MLEDLRVQYVEVNARSRWYASQTWQVPFAYIALVGLMAGSFKGENDLIALGVALKTAALLGLFVVIHLIVISWRIRELVKDLNDIERALSLPARSKNIIWIHGSMIMFLVASLIIFYMAGLHFANPA